MGVDYFTCTLCERNFPDCGHYGHCACEEILCGGCYDRCKTTYGSEETDDYGTVSLKCDNCALVTISDGVLLGFALTKFGVSREQLETELRAAALQSL